MSQLEVSADVTELVLCMVISSMAKRVQPPNARCSASRASVGGGWTSKFKRNVTAVQDTAWPTQVYSLVL